MSKMKLTKFNTKDKLSHTSKPARKIEEYIAIL